MVKKYHTHSRNSSQTRTERGGSSHPRRKCRNAFLHTYPEKQMNPSASTEATPGLDAAVIVSAKIN